MLKLTTKNPVSFAMPSLTVFSPTVRRRAYLTVAVLATLCSLAQAGNYSQNFSFPDGTTNLGDASAFAGSPAGVCVVQNGQLRLSNDVQGVSTASFKLPDLDSGTKISGFTVSFQLSLVKATAGAPGEGFAMGFGSLPANNGNGETGFNMASGLNVGWDMADTERGPHLRVRFGNQDLATVSASVLNPPGTNFEGTPNFYFDGTPRPVTITWSLYQGLTVSYAGQILIEKLPIPGFTPANGYRFGFTARNSASLYEGVFIDDLTITTTPYAPIATGGPVISEFMVGNIDTILDDDQAPSPWIEIYNGQGSAVNLSGWYLTDDPNQLTKWPLPAINLNVNAYTLIWADGKNRPSTTNPHTNFTLNPDGGYLALVRPDGTTIASSFTYGPQPADVSYGIMGPELVTGYLQPPTPKAENLSQQAPNPPLTEKVDFSHAGGLLADPLTLTVSQPSTPGAIIRYTLDNSLPHRGSPIFPASGLVLNNPDVPGALNSPVNIRAAIFVPDALPGPVTSRTFIPLDASLKNYRGTGQPFNSNLPIIVLDSFGKNVDSAGKVYNYCYGITFDVDPATGRASLIGPVDFQGRSRIRVRGETSASFAQRPYAWRLVDELERDKNASVLGYPSEHDWVLISNYNDKSLIRNKLPFDLMLEINGPGSAMRERYVEVFFRQTGNSPLKWGDYRGVYVFTERIKRDSNRVNIDRLNPTDGSFTRDPEVDDNSIISGGYLFRTDKPSDDPTFTTSRGHSLQLLSPSMPSATSQRTQAQKDQMSYITDYMRRFEAALYGNNFTNPTTGYAKYIDVDSFIENHLWVEIFKQIDGFRISTYYNKPRYGKVKSSPLWDYNLSLGNADYLNGFNPEGWYFREPDIWNTNTNYPWYKRLFEDPEFTLKYWDRYWKLRQGHFAIGTLMDRINNLVNHLSDGNPFQQVNNGTGSTTNPIPSVENPIGRHHARWKRLGVYDWPNAAGSQLRHHWNPATLLDWTTVTSSTNLAQINNEVDHVKSWLVRRLQWMDEQSMSFNTTVRNFKPPFLNHYGGEVPSGFQVVVTNPNGPEGSGPIYYTLDGTDPRPPGGGPPLPGTKSLGGVNASIDTAVLLPETSTGDYLVPSATNGGSTLTIADWTGMAPPPNDAQWQKNKPLGIGFKTSGTAFNAYIKTNIQNEMQPSGGTPNATVYLRTKFTITEEQIAKLHAFRLQARYDDGLLCYLNGTEIARAGVSNPNTFTPTWNSQGGLTRSDTSAATMATITNLPSIETLKTLLVPGENVLAFHGLNRSATDSDFLLQPRLEIDTLSVEEIPATDPLPPLASNTRLKLRIYNSASQQWSPLTEADFLVGINRAGAHNIVISEINYHPADPTEEEISAGFTDDNDFEFIEIMNISVFPVDLSGCRFTAGIEFDWDTLPSEKRTLPPGGRQILCNKAEAFLMRYPAAAPFVAGSYSGNLSNSGETLRLVAADGSDIKHFAYSDQPPWPAEADGQGYTLELVNPRTNPDHALASNWKASSTIGGTPGTGSEDEVPFSGDPEADDDGDGLPALLEYFFGTNPNAPNEPRSPIAAFKTYPVHGLNAVYFEFSFTRSAAITGVTYTIETTDGLKNWSNGHVPMVFVGSVSNGDGTITETWRSADPVATLGPALYARLKVMLLPNAGN